MNQQTWSPFSLGQIVEMMATYTTTDLNCTLVCGTKEIKCNRVILQLASDVFKALFDVNMKERETGIININDVDGEMMEIAVKYYEDGRILDGASIDHDNMKYIVEKYNFVVLKGAIAELILKQSEISKSVDMHNHVIEFYGNETQVQHAFEDIATQVLGGNDCPDFVMDLNPKSFCGFVSAFSKSREKIAEKHLGKTCAQCSRQRTDCLKLEIKAKSYLAWNCLFNIFESWLQKDFKGRSSTVSEILCLQEFSRGFGWKFAMEKVAKLTMGGEFTAYLNIISTLNERLDDDLISCPNCREDWICGKLYNNLVCEGCKHKAHPPFHATTICSGFHKCPKSTKCTTRCRLVLTD